MHLGTRKIEVEEQQVGGGGGGDRYLLLLVSVQYLQGSIYAVLAQVPGLVSGKIRQFSQQPRHIHVLVVVEMAKPPEIQKKH